METRIDTILQGKSKVIGFDGNSQSFIERFKQSHPFLKMPEVFTEESVFELWRQILEVQGPIVFDKSTQYLGNLKALELIYKFKRRGNDVRLFAFIRDARDSITSRYTLWKEASPKKLEIIWLEKYEHLEQLQTAYEYVPLFRYEDFSEAPHCYAPMIFDLCGVSHIDSTYDHITPTHVGRYSVSMNIEMRKWKMSPQFKQHLIKYGYSIPQMPFEDMVRLAVKTSMYTLRKSKGKIKRTIKRYFDN